MTPPAARTWRVGLIGAGPVIQAIHLPTLARLRQRARVTHIIDVQPDLARAVAAPLGATAGTTLAELIAARPDIVVVGSPDRYHAEQIAALCAAGVRVILAEKPLATSLAEAEQVEQAVRQSGATLVVGAMHSFDPAWLAAHQGFTTAGPYHVRSAVYLPDNQHFEDMATTMVRPPSPPKPAPTAQSAVRGGVLGLAIHDLPLIRHFLPSLEEVSFAAPLAPWGYTITAAGTSGTLELLARMPGVWRPDWTLSVWGDDGHLRLEFPPSYVQAGSATALIDDSSGQRRFGPYPANGYEAEWLEVLAIMDGARPRYPIEHLVADLVFALGLADAAVAALPGGGGAGLGADAGPRASGAGPGADQRSEAP